MNNPYAAPGGGANAGRGGLRFVDPSQLPNEPALGQIMLEPKGSKEVAATPWRMLLEGDRLWLAPANGPAVELTHQEFAEHVNLLMAGELCVFGIRGLEPIRTLQCPMSAIEPLVRWMGMRRDVHVGMALKKRLRAAVPIGIFVTVMSLPVLGGSFEPLSAAFGVSLIALAIVVRFSSHPMLFLGLAANWLLLAASNVPNIMNGSRVLIPFALIALLLGYGALKSFAFYRRVTSHAHDQPSRS